jgi:di/tricarboxylate transporter
MAVALAASAGFLAPVAHQANVLVMGPGGYRFGDYLKAGAILDLLTFLVVLFVLPLIWPWP